MVRSLRPRRNRPHDRPFGAVAIAAAAENADDPARGQSLQGRQGVFESVRRVGIVHVHPPLVAAFHAFQSSRHAGYGLQPGADRVGCDARAIPAPAAQRRSLDVMAPHQAGADIDALAARAIDPRRP